MTEAQQPLRLNGIVESDYQAWRHHPVTRLLLQYIADYRDVLVRETITRWEGGGLVLADEHEMRARVMILKELGELPWSAIQEFYQMENDASDTETA